MAAPPMTAPAGARTAVAEAPKRALLQPRPEAASSDASPPIQAATVMADVSKPVVAAPPVQAAAVQAPTMMADAPRPVVAAPPAPAPAPAPAPLVAPSLTPSTPDAIMSITAELPPAPGGNTNTTRQVDSNEINRLLAAEQNKTREINSSEIEALLAQSRDDPDKK